MNLNYPHFRESPEFREEQVRVLLLRDAEPNRKKVLYDSQAVQRVPITDNHLGISQKGKCHGKNSKVGKQDGFVEMTDGYGYQVIFLAVSACVYLVKLFHVVLFVHPICSSLHAHMQSEM